jgi:predicted PurR-regulated permease PerM
MGLRLSQSRGSLSSEGEGLTPAGPRVVPHPAGARRRARAARTLARPLWILALCAAVAALRLGRDLLLPLVLGVLLALMLSGIVESLRRLRIPRGVSALVLLVILAAAAGGMLDALAAPAQEWMASAPRVLRTLERRMRPAQSVLRRVDAIAERARALAGSGEQAAVPVTAAPSVTAVGVLAGTGFIAGGLLMGVALTVLLLSAGPATLARMTATLASDWQAIHVLRIIDAIRVEVGRYYRTLAVINLCFGAATALIMWLLGMPNPMLWGAVAGVLNFVPYLGCATTATILTLVALVSFDHVSHAALVAASFLVLAAVEGHIIEPVFVGRRLDLNPIAVLVALWLAGWMWGIPGVVFALPVLVATKVAAAHSANGSAVVRFLSPRNSRLQRALAAGSAVYRQPGS